MQKSIRTTYLLKYIQRMYTFSLIFLVLMCIVQFYIGINGIEMRTGFSQKIVVICFLTLSFMLAVYIFWQKRKLSRNDFYNQYYSEEEITSITYCTYLIGIYLLFTPYVEVEARGLAFTVLCILFITLYLFSIYELKELES